MTTRSLAVAISALSLSAGLCHGLMTEDVGPDSARSHPTVAQPRWPEGLVELFRHETRVYSVWCNGGETVYFRADEETIIELILLFSEVRMRDHELRVELGTQEAKSFRKGAIEYNLSLNVTTGIARAMADSRNTAATHEPVLTLHLESDADAAWLNEFRLPGNIILTTNIAGLSAKHRPSKPERHVWHAMVHFDDGKPATDFESGVSTRVTLWEKGIDTGIKLGQVNHEGRFHAAFSDDEIEELRAGTSWITLTPGNWLTKAKSDHPRLPPVALTRDRELAKPVTIPRPGYYHGRLLFEDGSPPILDPLPWPGADISISFPYGGGVEPDAEGYFRLYFTEEQFRKLSDRKPRRNIYVPNYGKKGRSSALHIFPPSALGRSKDTAGVVKIPRPTP